MGSDHVSLDHEFFEVINAFPVLEDVLTRLDVSISSLEEGVSVNSYLESLGFGFDEISILLSKMNQEISLFLRNGSVGEYDSKRRKKSSALGIEMIS